MEAPPPTANRGGRGGSSHASTASGAGEKDTRTAPREAQGARSSRDECSRGLEQGLVELGRSVKRCRGSQKSHGETF
ncbi:hypothetical protein AVEN_252377-1 [Araneus ventricosus]|uniref:Uncharacterized protein n=1 Tax=Araneus ventricosus TaxID=182803 RepID=A0A4Y2ASN6_ARAVE|nr:hypothetical protein AVEN_252377-1 [Araneus ventricosus]